MDMRVHTNPQFPKSDRKNEVGRLATHTRQRQKLIQRIGDLPQETPQQMLANLMDPF